MLKLSAAFAAFVVGCSFGFGGLNLSTASAQSGHGGTGKPKERDEPQFDRDGPKRPAATSETPAKEAPTAAEALDHALPVITTWPGQGGENALLALIARGPDLIPLLRARLKGGTVLERSASARALCLLADKESFGEIEKLFADPRQRARFAPLLESLFELDPIATRALALRFLGSEQAPLRTAATSLVRAHPTSEVTGELKTRLLAAREDGVRFDLFNLLELLGEPELPTIALERFLGDSSPPLAARATLLLAKQESPELRGELARLAATNHDRRGLHAALALAITEQQTGARLLADELFDLYLPTLKTNDLLLRMTSCIVCALVGYRNESRAEVTQAQVVPALAEVVVNGRFFGDFEICFKTAVTALELSTGEHLGSSVPAWREWFSKHPSGKVEGRRELQALVLEEDERAAEVTLSRADATGQPVAELVLCGEAHRAPIAFGGRPGAVALTASAMRELLVGLERLGLLSGELPRVLPEAAVGDLLLGVTTRGRERTLALVANDPKVALFTKLIDHAVEPFAWQVLLASDDHYSSRFAEEQAWFSTHPAITEQRSRILDLALARIATDDPLAARQAFAMLDRIGELGTSVRAHQIDAVAVLLAKLSAADPRARKLFELLIATGRDDAFDKLADALALRGTTAVEWIADAIVRLGRIDRALGDERGLVRLAGLTAAERQPAGVVDETRLTALARTDVEERVRAKALALLARAATDGATATLLDLAEHGTAGVQMESLRLLGFAHRDDALACLVAAARGSDAALAAAALEGLARRGDEAAGAALDGIVRERGPIDTVGRIALAAIKGLPRAIALARIRKLMNEAGGALAHEAAYGLADLGEMEAVPALLADLEDEKLHRRAQTLLTYLFCTDVGTEAWRFRSLQEAAPAASHVDHFFAALSAVGVIVPESKELRDRALLPMLVAAIEDQRWFVRRTAIELLEAMHGRSLGGLSVTATPAEIAALAARWREVIATQAAGAPAGAAAER